MKMRGLLVTAGSFVLTTGVVINAYVQKKQFYPTVVYLTKSSPCLAVLYIQALVLALLFGKLLKNIFFGQLRPAETEHLIERSWYAVTDTCLAFTMFRDDFSPAFVASFTFLLFSKCFHWLLEDRVDYMERSPIITLLFKIRVISLLIILLCCDAVCVYFSYQSMISKGASVQLVFGFEYAILATVIITVFFKYVLHVIDLQYENPWENKAVFMLYVELITGFLRVILYVCFTAIMVKVHTFPLFSVRPMYLTMRQFKKTVYDIILSRRAIQNMNTLYPDATPEELANTDSICIICREEMTPPVPGQVNTQGTPKKLPCGHIFHSNCLRSWFQRQQTCPTCRMNVLTAPQPTNANQQGAPAAGGNAAAGGAAQQPPPPPPAHPAQHPYGPMFPAMYPPPPHPAMFQNPPPTATAAPAASGTQAPTSTTPTASASGTTSSTTPPAGGEMPTMPPPPFAMPPPPFFMAPPPFMPPPPPVPPVALSGLSDEQLKELEKSERKAVEARIECLRNIRALLDASVRQIELYTTICQLNGEPGIQLPPGPAMFTAPPTTPTTSATTNETATSSPPANSQVPKTETASPSAVKVEVKVEPVEPEVEHGTIDNDEDEPEPTDSNELRRRRLARLESKDEPSSNAASE